MKYIGFPRPSYPLGNTLEPQILAIASKVRASPEAIVMAQDSGFARGQSVGHWNMTDSGAIFNDLHWDIGR